MPFASTPNLSDFDAYRVTNPNFAEVIRQPLFDYNLLPGAGAQRLAFFQQAIGQGVTSALGATVGVGKTASDTNMTLAGQLPSGLQFLAESLEIPFYPGASSVANTYTPQTVTFFAAAAAVTVGAHMNDANTFYQGGLLEFNVLAKNYLRISPLLNFVPKRSFDLNAAVASNSATVGEVGAGVLRAGGMPFDLEPPIALLPTVSFEVVLTWPAVVALPSGFNARVGVILDGYQGRAGQ